MSDSSADADRDVERMNCQGCGGLITNVPAGSLFQSGTWEGEVWVVKLDGRAWFLHGDDICREIWLEDHPPPTVRGRRR